MKKRTLALLSSAFLLYACGNEEADQEPAETEEEEVEETEPVEEEPEEENTEEPDEEEEVEEEEASYRYQVTEDYARVEVIEGEEAEERVALLTYDDAPDGNALEIADVLEEYGVNAIFFVNGMFIDRDNGEEELLELHERGFEIGNHSYTHPNFRTDLATEEEQYEEIISTSDRIEEITGERPRFFRFPFGAYTDYAIEVAQEDGMEIMQWTFGYDFEADYMEADALADITVNTELLTNGSNILMHDREWTLEATPDIIEGLQANDFEIVDPAEIRSVDVEDQEEE